MQHLAASIDYLLYVLVALTFAVIIYKAAILYGPGLAGKTPASRDKADIDEHVETLENGMALLAVMASAAPFVGLAGTVLHIMQALSRLSSAAIDITLISGPIATALNSTLVGLCAAVPALVAYNLMQRRIQVLHNRLLRAAKGEAR
ncbi:MULTISPECIES: MotA/TolQ/ExbB proton channel family protein [unclassified Variovorax]|uniref:MotA/TolQ/ExbB proton channel family protein n=1 Tax=unclassified Variovorax TaxID=663243 RepID=UPI00076D81C5|nr:MULTISPECIES: MotA/TolQ/ExbB proton channel family protein [unclassified Variovorax]KWT98420.1 MotA/TolQ/ExbB proton channel family protein [Variovorax sp. WDL1]PNG49911.1 Biopolymer transport protein ExbB [Variovorax sp. B2]PNG50783.1 Biopolymer transport protein ExbB [Variovorax sp. B4]VTV18001.1 Protein TolQ [Variovorax sp. WDL1]